MNNTAEAFEELQNRCLLQEQQNAELTAKITWYDEQFHLSQQKRFGRSSEQTNWEQMQLFNEAEKEAKPSLPEPTMEEITYKRREKQGHREAQLKDLPVETIEYRLSSEEQICPCCGGDLHEMSTEVWQGLKIIPAQVSVVKHVRYVYACRRCEREKIKTPIVTAPMPAPVLPGSLVSPSAMAHIMTQELDNNRSERSIKPFVIGHKNWLFANTPKGAKASATIYSTVESAKETGLNPFNYLQYYLKNYLT